MRNDFIFRWTQVETVDGLALAVRRDRGAWRNHPLRCEVGITEESRGEQQGINQSVELLVVVKGPRLSHEVTYISSGRKYEGAFDPNMVLAIPDGSAGEHVSLSPWTWHREWRKSVRFEGGPIQRHGAPGPSEMALPTGPGEGRGTQ